MGYTVVKDYVRIERARGHETFVPLAHPPGHAQVDFGEAVGVIGGVRQKIHHISHLACSYSATLAWNLFAVDSSKAWIRLGWVSRSSGPIFLL